MDAVTTAQRMTVDEFLALEPDDRWLELIDGELVVNQPAWLHNQRQVRLCTALQVWIDSGSGRGAIGLPANVVFDERNVYAPDLLWYREERAPRLRDRAPYPVPDLAVEIRSPSTWRHDVGVKKTTYERHGLAELWLVDTAADAVLVFRRSEPAAPDFDVSLELGTDATLTSPLLPGFALVLGALFATG